jgi:hypothetical protein
MFRALMWFVTGWASKLTYDKFVRDVAALKAAKKKEYGDAFASGMASSDALGVSTLADAFAQHGEPGYAAKLRAHVTDLQQQAARVIVTPPPEPQAPLQAPQTPPEAGEVDAPEEAA